MQTEGNKPDLLIVDDDPLITDTLNFVLSRDFSVYVADSRTRVKNLLRQLDNPPQLALIDRTAAFPAPPGRGVPPDQRVDRLFTRYQDRGAVRAER